jgi:hypothetical protein
MSYMLLLLGIFSDALLRRRNCENLQFLVVDSFQLTKLATVAVSRFDFVQTLKMVILTW